MIPPFFFFFFVGEDWLQAKQPQMKSKNVGQTSDTLMVSSKSWKDPYQKLEMSSGSSLKTETLN